MNHKPTRYTVPPGADIHQFINGCLEAWSDEPDVGMLQEGERLDIIFGAHSFDYLYGRIGFRPIADETGPIIVEEESDPEPEKPPERWGEVTAFDSLNLRTEPGYRNGVVGWYHPKIGQLSHVEQVRILDEAEPDASGLWYQVTTAVDGRRGWASAKWIEEQEPS